jgi:hypothetical protein
MAAAHPGFVIPDSLADRAPDGIEDDFVVLTLGARLSGRACPRRQKNADRRGDTPHQEAHVVGKDAT